MALLSASNLLWPSSQEDAYLTALRDLGYSGVELALTKIFGIWDEFTIKDIQNYRQKLDGLGLQVSALQAIMFGFNRPVFDTGFFDDCAEHYQKLADYSSALGSRTLIFGSPYLRRRKSLEYSEARKRAADAFQKIGDILAPYQIYLGFEANPVEYGCDFLNNQADVIAFVRDLGHPNIANHIDTGALVMNGDNQIDPYMQDTPIHLHVSAPSLGPITSHHGALMEILSSAKTRYKGWVSLEMKDQLDTEANMSCLRLVTEMISNCDIFEE